MKSIEERLKELEISEKKLKNKTIWLTALVPIITIAVSVITTFLTFENNFEIDKQNFTQEQVTIMLKEQDLIVARKKMKFLVINNLIGHEESSAKLISSMNEILIDKDQSETLYVSGIENFRIAYSENNSSKPDKMRVRKYYFKASSIQNKAF